MDYTGNIWEVSCGSGNWANCEIALEMLNQNQFTLTIVIEQANTDLLIRSDEIEVSISPISALLPPPTETLTEHIASHLQRSEIPRSFRKNE